jgi:DNA processing protein
MAPHIEALLARTQLDFAGDRSLLELPCVAIVGSRDASELGKLRARRLARELVAAGVVVMSGLARGIDTAALEEAIAQGGQVIAVIATALDRAYPPENAALQRQIAKDHLLISALPLGAKNSRASFPARNRVMAALGWASAIIEATDRSGTLHQATEARRLGRPLFVAASTWNSPAVTWPRRFEGPKTFALTDTRQILAAIGPGLVAQ